jgi:hypothetical protein
VGTEWKRVCGGEDVEMGLAGGECGCLGEVVDETGVRGGSIDITNFHVLKHSAIWLLSQKCWSCHQNMEGMVSTRGR